MKVGETVSIRNARQAVLSDDRVDFGLRLPLNVWKADHGEEKV